MRWEIYAGCESPEFMRMETAMRTILVFCLASILPAVVWAQQSAAGAGSQDRGERACTDTAATRAAQQIVDTWKEGYNSGDAARVAALYTEDAYYLTQHFARGIVHGRARIQAYVQRGVDAHYHIDDITILHIGCSGDFMYVITRYESTNAGQKAFGVNLVLTRKTPRGWRILAHEAAVPDPATAVKELDVPGPQ